jgi:hypothetical protein
VAFEVLDRGPRGAMSASAAVKMRFSQPAAV